MSEEVQSFIFEQEIHASPAQVYRAFTNATALREWMCDFATTSPHPGGRIYLAWNSGFFTAGQFTACEPDHHIAFTWFGPGEPAPTYIDLVITPTEAGAQVRLEHGGVGCGPNWAKTIEEVEYGWKDSMDNLASVLGEGPDLRLVRRPMLGITIADFTPEHAARLGVPVTEGLRLDSVVAGMGAQVAGLQNNDVLVSLAGRPVTDYPSLVNALQRKRGGDVIEVVFYRGPEKRTVQMELSRRPIPDIPPTPAALAARLEQNQAAAAADYDRLLEGVSEQEAGFHPRAGEWSVKEILAHLIQSERATANSISEQIGSQVSWTDDFSGNQNAYIQATLVAYPTLAELRDALRRAGCETVALLRLLPAEFVARQGSYWALAYNMVETPYHLYTHLEQVKAALAAARSAS